MNIVYVLSNPAMPDLVKIGMTDQADVRSRMRDLYSATGVPLPFECHIAWRLSEEIPALKVERAIHEVLSPVRINPNREFFKTAVEGLKALLRTYPGCDVTPRVTEVLSEEQEDREAATRYQQQEDQTNESEFLESLEANGRVVYERVLAWAKQNGLGIRWGRKGFTAYVPPTGTVVCRGFPPASYRQCLHSESFKALGRAGLSEEMVEALRAEALQTGLFEPMGQGDRLRCETDRPWDEAQLTALIDWLGAVAQRVRDGETFHTDGAAAEE